MVSSVQARVLDREWLARAILAGFVGTITMGIVLIIGFVVASNAGSAHGGTLTEWEYGLAHNRVTNLAQNRLFEVVGLYLVFGIVWALIYARVFEPLRSGPAWRAGMVFSLVPFALSLVAFLPATGGGFFGGDLRSGPLPVFGNLIAHLVYGATLGGFYGASNQLKGDAGEGEAADDRAERRLQRDTNRAGAVGLLIGVVVGSIGGVILGLNVYPPTSANTSASLIAGAGELSLAGAVLGASLGALAGSMIGLNTLDTVES